MTEEPVPVERIESAVRYAVEETYLTSEPFYVPIADEIEIFAAAYHERLPVLLKGPTGVGKTRFVEHMAWRLGRPLTTMRHQHGAPQHAALPLVTVACHEDLTASDLVGRYLLDGEGTRWVDGPLTRAVLAGAICYLDEIVEARKDTAVLIHPLTDHRRLLPIEKRGELILADNRFQIVISYNPGYQSVVKDLKHSTRQRFVAMEFGSPPRHIEAQIIAHEAEVGDEIAARLALLGEKVRHLREQGLPEGVSTRLLIYAGRLMRSGLSARRACQVAVVWALTDDAELQQAIAEVVTSIFP